MRRRPCMPRLRPRRTASATVFAANAAAATDAGADTDTSTETNVGADPHAKAEAKSKTCVKLSGWLRIPGPGGPGSLALFAGGDASDE